MMLDAGPSGLTRLISVTIIKDCLCRRIQCGGLNCVPEDRRDPAIGGPEARLYSTALALGPCH